MKYLVNRHLIECEYGKRNLGQQVFQRRISKFGSQQTNICTVMLLGGSAWEPALFFHHEPFFSSHWSITIWICILLLEIFFSPLSSTILLYLIFPQHHNIPTLIRPCFDFNCYPPDFALRTFLSAAAASQRDRSTPASSLPDSFDELATGLQCKTIMFSATFQLLISAKLTCTASSDGLPASSCTCIASNKIRLWLYGIYVACI